LLLDLSLRNRLLSFRQTKRSTIMIEGEDPKALFHLLLAEGKSLAFLPKQEDGNEATVKDPKDKNLACELPALDLQRNLLHLERQARSFLEEKGINALYLALGFVEWRREDKPDRVLHAPLLLIPVRLERTSVAKRFRLRALDHDPITNPSLKALFENNYGLNVPSLDEEQEAEDQDLAAFFDKWREALAPQADWRINSKACLSLFSFAKIIMHADLDPARWQAANRDLLAHPLLRSIAGGEAPPPPPPGTPVPPEALDAVTPNDNHQVLEADSSQQRAILSAKRGLSFVLEGPPGTGKSQTIANTIAECLAAGKKVLFVSQKIAALDVVKRRLDAVGLGDFCLELHSTKASRKGLVRELGRVLDRGRLETDSAEALATELSELRQALGQYAKELHEPLHSAGRSPHQAMARMARLHQCPDIFCELPESRHWDEENVRVISEQIARLGRAAGQVKPLEQNPWRACLVEDLTTAEQAELFEILAKAEKKLAQSRKESTSLAASLGMEAPSDLAELDQLLASGEHLASSTGVDEKLLMGTLWNEFPEARKDLLANLEELSEIRAWAKERYQAKQLSAQDWPSIHKRVNSRRGNPFRVFLPSHWRDKKIFREARRPEHLPKTKEKADDLKRLAVFKSRLAEIKQADARGHAAFGLLWRGASSDPSSLKHLADWLHKSRRLWLEGKVGQKGLEQALEGVDRKPLKAQTTDLRRHLDAFSSAWAWAEKTLNRQTVEQESNPKPTENLNDLGDRITRMRAKPESLLTWMRFQSQRSQALGGPLAKFLKKAEDKGLDPSIYAAAFEKQYLRLLIEAALAERKTLGEFDGRDHEASRERFAQVEPAWLKHNRLRLHAKLSQERPLTQFGSAGSSQLGILQGEIARKRGGRPIRRIFADAAEVVSRLKPCLMMSPLSVAQYLAPGGLDFDLVIFDEASQVEPADALGAIARGRQLMLVGDTRQLPPTAFFNQVGAEDPDSEDDGSAGLNDMESILDRGAQLLPKLDLLWHYRSRHDSLVAFANKAFYDSRLLVFPAAQRQTDDLGLKMRYHPEDFYERGTSGSNPAQARRLADWIFEQLKAHPDKSLGVGTFSQAQQQVILDAIEDKRRADDSLETLFHPDRPDPFFVKNLETIQGDERDVIALSIGYGKPSSDKPLSMNFGPLNHEGGWRRLNVLITRARERCVIFSSIRPEDFRLDNTKARGVHALCDYLRCAFAEASATRRAKVDTPSQGDLEQALIEALGPDSYDLSPQLGGGPFSLDLALSDPAEPERYLLGLACDGAAYRDAWTVRDRDRAFDAVLTRLGWSLHRVWSPDWYRSPKLSIERVHLAIENARKKQHEQAKKPQATAEASGEAALRKADEQAEDFGFEPYRRFRPKRPRTSAQFYKLSPERLAGVLLEIIDEEGPIHEDVAISRLAESWGLGRVGSKVRSIGRRSVKHAVRYMPVARRGDFLWPKHLTVPKVRYRKDEDLKDAAHICQEELGQAAVTLLQIQFGMSREDLLQQTARALGFANAGRKIKAAVELAVHEEIDRGRIAEGEDDFLHPPDDKTPAPRSKPQSQAGPKGPICPGCAKSIKANTKFCPHCGLKMKQPTCPACQTQVKPKAKFCPNCGHSLH